MRIGRWVPMSKPAPRLPGPGSISQPGQSAASCSSNVDGGFNANTPTALFNGWFSRLNLMVLPRNWYQGESNIGRSDEYAQLLPAMIADWRKHWKIATSRSIGADCPYVYSGSTTVNPRIFARPRSSAGGCEKRWYGIDDGYRRGTRYSSKKQG